MNQQPTVPHRAVHQAAQPTVPHQRPLSHQRPLPPQRPAAKRRRQPGCLLPLLIGGLVVGLSTAAALMLGAALIYGGGVLRGVRVDGVALGGMSQTEAAAHLAAHWTPLTLTDPATGRAWPVRADSLGITLDAAASAEAAYAYGRGVGSLVDGLRGVDLPPVVSVDAEALRVGLEALRPDLESAPVNAGIQVVGGVLSERPAQPGRRLDLDASVSAFMTHTGGAWALVMDDVPPQVTDAGGLLTQARALLESALRLRVFDPVTGDSVHWDIAPETWAAWLLAGADGGLSLDTGLVSGHLDQRAAGTFDATRAIDSTAAAEALSAAVGAGQTQALTRVQHQPRQHTVQPGETIISIAWDYGIPYPYVQQANPGVGALSVGQVLTIPAADRFLLHPAVPDKRIEVSISGQRVRVYEGGALKWDWAASTGIDDSPTWPGVYQVISQVPNAYAANWNLYMPSFIGVYQPIPGQDFTNGFHGFPTRGGGQILWENSLGTRVTYGCILLSNTNAQALYQWAETGVVVVIRP